MDSTLAAAESVVGWAGGLAAVITLAAILTGFRRSDARPAGTRTGPATRFLRWTFLAAATVLWIGIGVLLWRPLPLVLGPAERWAALAAGSALLFGGLAVYWWGLRTMGEMFGAASGFGVRLYAAHHLITNGPFAIVRHPMYLGVMTAFAGGLLVYRTWAALAYALMVVGLPLRARKEEQALAGEFGDEWEVYRRRTPGWFPRARSKPEG